MTTLVTSAVVRLAEDVEDRIYNFNPSDAPLLAMIDRVKISNPFHEWNRDSYRAVNAANAAIQGADASTTVLDQPGPLNNRTQIFQDGFKIANTVLASKAYGRANEAAYQKSKCMVELKRDIEAAIIGNGASVTADGSTAGVLRGLYGFITNDHLGAAGSPASPNPVTNTAPTAGTPEAITEADFKTGIQTCYENGGDASIAMVSPSHKVKISTWASGVTRNVDVGKEAATVNVAFDFYRHDFGITKVVPNRVMTGSAAGLVNTMYILDADKLALGQLRGFESEELAKTGDARRWQVRTEVTLIVRDEKPLYAIRDATVSGS